MTVTGWLCANGRAVVAVVRPRQRTIGRATTSDGPAESIRSGERVIVLSCGGEVVVGELFVICGWRPGGRLFEVVLFSWPGEIVVGELFVICG
ncbi:MAG TPA: hypothetical protein VH084_28010 [Mycobacterium sp.]|nr:hypothetical protein [Mycobacterium sp.]